jgi:hypothetical protein
MGTWLAYWAVSRGAQYHDKNLANSQRNKIAAPMHLMWLLSFNICQCTPILQQILCSFVYRLILF